MLNFYKKLYNLIYILQLYEYEIRPFLLWLKQHPSWLDLERKSKLKFTAKVNLIIVLTCLLGVITFIIITIWFFTILPPELSFLLILLLFLEYYKLFPAFIIISLMVLKPVEMIIRLLYVILARLKRAKCRRVKVIGIAGSYGKTTMKEFLAIILSERFKVLKTPGNINTLIGIARLIIKKLTSEYEIFIAEIGAYKIGDIKRVCKLINPSIGILTGINEAHLERFGSLENTIKAKFEIIDYLPADGIALINKDDINIKRVIFNFLKDKVVGYSLEGEQAGFRVDNIITTELGTSFNIHKIDKWDMEVNLPILGSHNVRSVLGCVILCDLMGMSKKEIQRGLQNIKAIEHRLSPAYNKQSDILIIDDTYNANPEGVRCALDILTAFKNKRKIIISQGIVEVGAQTEKLNREIGKEIAKVADLVILIKNNISDYILNSLLDEYYSRNKILIFNSFDEVTESLPGIITSGDVVLFQNDLPDQYAISL